MSYKYDEEDLKYLDKWEKEDLLYKYGGDHSVDVKADVVSYPFIYRYLKYGFDISKLELLDVWLEQPQFSSDILYLISKSPMRLKFSHDSHISDKKKKKLIDNYFNLIDFTLINKMSIKEYNKTLDNPIISTSEVLEELKEQFEKAQKNTETINKSHFKDLIYNKLGINTKQKVKGKQKVKK